MKQKVLLNVSIDYKKKCPCFIFGELTTHSKALQIVASSSGVESAAWEEGDKSKLEGTGEGIDLILLTKKLKKKIGYTTVVSVEEKKEEKEEKKEVPAVVWHPVGFSQYQYYELPPSNHGGCTIM